MANREQRMVVSKQSSSKPGKAQSTVVTTTKTMSAPKSGNRYENKSKEVIPRNSPLLDWARTIADPWQYGPVKLGYNTMVETTLASAFLRTSFQVGTDGSFSLILNPCVTNMVWLSTGGLNTATYTALSAADSVGIGQQLAGARVISGGIRAIALFPETAASGVLVSGAFSFIPSGLWSSNLTPASMFQQPTANLGYGGKGARTVILPIDNSAQEFSAPVSNAVGFGSTVNIPYTVPYIAGQGFPVGTIIWYEAILNLEGLPSTGSSAIGINVDSIPQIAGTPASSGKTYELAANWVRRAIGSPTVMEGAAGLLDGYGYHSLSNFVRSAFGSGHNSRLVAGQSARRQARQNSVVIEEMESDLGHSASSSTGPHKTKGVFSFL